MWTWQYSPVLGQVVFAQLALQPRVAEIANRCSDYLPQSLEDKVVLERDFLVKFGNSKGVFLGNHEIQQVISVH